MGVFAAVLQGGAGRNWGVVRSREVARGLFCVWKVVGFVSAPLPMAENRSRSFPPISCHPVCLLPVAFVCVMHFRESDEDPSIGHPQSLLVLLVASLGPAFLFCSL